VSKGLPRDWSRLLADHSAAVEEYLIVAGRISADGWVRPLASGRWTPAEVTSHVLEAYRVLRAELAGADGMRMLGSRLQRWVLRYTVLPRLLAGRPFPPGIRAPRETRPRDVLEDRHAALRALGELAEAFTQELTSQAAGGTIRLTHAYFGPLSPRQGLRLLAVHTRHHAHQLAAVAV
jgi:hypothetical protein